MEGLGPIGEVRGRVGSIEPKTLGEEGWIGEEGGQRLGLGEPQDELGLVVCCWEWFLLRACDIISNSLVEITWGDEADGGIDLAALEVIESEGALDEGAKI